MVASKCSKELAGRSQTAQLPLDPPFGPPAGRRTKRFASLVNIKDAVTSRIMTKKVLLSPNLKPAAGPAGAGHEIQASLKGPQKKAGHIKCTLW